MKTIIVCFPNGQAIRVNVRLGMHISEIAKEYPTANLYWIDAPLSLPKCEMMVIRYEPL